MTDPAASYWSRNLRYVVVSLVVWFVVSYGFGILLAEPLNSIRIPGTGFKLGFWFAQQGSIYVFVLLIFAYVVAMNRLDDEYERDEAAERDGVEERDEAEQAPEATP